ncbi:hypothetical protein SAMN05216436_10643 [bacterium A37T11]|nr:hypothetical protein SAMN05216436_10643 [bacterium A37T11]
MNKFFLFLVRTLSPVWTNLGVDPRQLLIILSVKLRMDDRNPRASFGKQAKEKKTTYATVLQFFMLLLMGSFFMAFFFMVQDHFVASSLYFLSVMSVLSLSLVADFSTILLDTRDQYIILPRPVSDRTVAIARIVHIAIKVLSQLLALGLPAFCYFLFLSHWSLALIFILQFLIAGLMSIFAVNLFYLFFLRVLNAQRFKDIISYLQIFLSILIFSAYYVGPKLLSSPFIQQLRIEHSAWTWVLPPVWIASLQQIGAKPLQEFVIVLAILALVTPILALWLTSRIFSSGFGGKLAALGAGDIPSEKIGLHSKPKGNSFYKLLGQLFTTSHLERAGFNIVWLISGRSREFKQQLYPTLAYLPVYFIFLIFLNGNKGDQQSFAGKLAIVESNGLYVVMYYMALLSLMTVLQLVSTSNQFKAAWVYYVSPVSKPGELMSGVLKAGFIKFFIPFSFFFLAISLPLFGFKVLNDLLLSVAIGGIEAVIIALFVLKAYPFSRPVGKINNKFLVNIMLMSFIGLFGYAHYFFIKHELVIWVATAIMWGIFLIMLRYFKDDKWESLGYAD